MSAVKLARPREGYLTIVFTDASETHLSSITTQVPTEDRCPPLREHRHERLWRFYPVSSKMPASTGRLQRRGGGKEAFPIVQTLSVWNASWRVKPQSCTQIIAT
jgi:hypothetical protein